MVRFGCQLGIIVSKKPEKNKDIIPTKFGLVKEKLELLVVWA